jgi:hypothetical protein
MENHHATNDYQFGSGIGRFYVRYRLSAEYDFYLSDYWLVYKWGTSGKYCTECDYAGYTRVTVGRTISDWDVTNNVASNLNLLSFGECTSGSNTVRYVELWRDNVSTNESERIAWAMTSAQVSVAAGVSPVFQPGDITFTFD